MDYTLETWGLERLKKKDQKRIEAEQPYGELYGSFTIKR